MWDTARLPTTFSETSSNAVFSDTGLLIGKNAHDCEYGARMPREMLLASGDQSLLRLIGSVVQAEIDAVGELH
jgi:hypothetical protein